MARPTLTLDIVSDVMCPWCYIGKRKLEAARPLLGDMALDIRWRPFQLDPTIPQGGMDRKAYLDGKFGPDRAKDVYDRVRAAGDSVGIAFDFAAIARSPNTIDAHRLIRWAATAGCQDAVVERLFRLYFTEGADIGDAEVLAGVAADVGMDADLVRELLAGDSDVELVEREVALAQAMGVNGVPGFIFAGKYLVPGAQDPAVLAEVAQKAADEDTGAAQPALWA
jgi:predicted DsbA family dithiol-disulfide isomerase